MANDDKLPNLEKRLDHHIEILDDLDSEIQKLTRYHFIDMYGFPAALIWCSTFTFL